MSRTSVTRRRFAIGGALSLAGALGATALLLAAPGEAPVLDAARRDDLAAVKALLRGGADVNATQADGLTALHWAALNGDLPMSRVLLYAGANVAAATRLGAVTPLDIAAGNGRAPLVQALLDAGADPAGANARGTTPLMLAAGSGSVPTVTALLDAGADVNAVEHVRNETALMFAAAQGRADVIRVLLAHGADWKPATRILDWAHVSPTDPRLLQVDDTAGTKAADDRAPSGAPGPAAGGGRRAGSSRFLAYPRLVGTQGGLTALLFAARQGHADAVQALVDGGADINQVDPGDRTSPLMIAIVNGHFDLAERMLASGADVNLAQVSGATPLYAVLNCVWAPRTLYPQPTAYRQQETSYLTLIRDLLAHGADPNARLRTKVWYSAYNFDQSGVDEAGATPFWRAAYADDVDAMKLLVAHGADPNLPTTRPAGAAPSGAQGYDAGQAGRDLSGRPPLPVGGPDISPLLAASGEGYGWSFTANHHRYAPAGMLPAVKYLVDVLHADVNARDADGNTPLHNAASRGDDAMVLFLVSRGADVKAINRKGQSVVDLANGPMQRTQPFPETIALLERLGAKVLHKCVSC